MDTNSWKKFKITEGLVNSLLILILGFLVGVAAKTEAKRRITIGYDDYAASQMKQGFDLMEKSPDSVQPNNQEGDVQPGPESEPPTPPIQ